MDHIMCGPHEEKWIKFFPYKLAKVCPCKWKDECKPFIGVVIFRKEVKHLEIAENEDDEKNDEREEDDVHSDADNENIKATHKDDAITEISYKIFVIISYLNFIL